MAKIRKNCAVGVWAAAIALLILVPLAQAEVINFDGTGYAAGAAPPAPWTDRYTATGDPKADLVYQVVSGVGVGGTQALTVLHNGYYEGAAVYMLPTSLTVGHGPQHISVMMDPSQNSPLSYGYNFTGFGGVSVGRGWMQDGSDVYRGVSFLKQDWSHQGGNDASDFPISGPGGLMGYFVPSAAHSYYEIAFDINAAFNSILVTVTAPGGSTMTQTTDWDGGPITKVWLLESEDNWNGQPVYYDNLTISATPEPATLSLLGLGLAGLIARRRKQQA